MTWRSRAECRETPEHFFPDDDFAVREAKKMCAQCPVRNACLEEALRFREPYGIWGGLTPEERWRFQATVGTAVSA